MNNTSQLVKIIEGLKHPRPFKRSKAVDDLMHMQDESVIPQLFKLTLKETDFVKVQVCRYLGHVAKESCIHPLSILLLDKSDRVSEEAAHALDNVTSDKKIDALIVVLKRRKSRFSTIFSIKSLGRAGAVRAIPYLVDLLSPKEEDHIREVSIEALRQIGDFSATRPLLKILKDKSLNIVYLAIIALGEIGEHPIGIDIIGFLHNENANLRRAAIWALSRLNYEKAIPEFIKMLNSDPNEVVRQEVAKRLGRIAKSHAVRPLMLAKSYDENSNVRIYAAWSLRNIPLHEKEKVMAHLVSEKDEVLRGGTILEMGRTGSEKFFTTLSLALRNDKSEFVRASAAEGLSFIQKPEVEPLLKRVLNATDNLLTRKAIIKSLGKIGDDQTISFLNDYKKDEEDEIALEEIKDAIERIEERLKYKKK